MPAKSKDKYTDVFRTWKKAAELSTDKQLKAVRTDNAPELLKVVDEWTQETDVRLLPTAPYTSSQNGVAERAIQNVEQIAKALLIQAKLPIRF